MMTFEEFLKKKKIDPVQLQSAEPSLFSEFNSHFSQMGEKSFDHSKKFWFNKLRRSFHLKEEPKAVPAKEIIEINEIASQAEPLISPTLEATGVPPQETSTAVPKPAFKPRFKAATTPSVSKPETDQSSADPEKPKPAYVPRFKASVPSQEAERPVEEVKPEAIPDQPKPAFKPRFNANLTKSPAANTEPDPIKTEPSANPEPEKPASEVIPAPVTDQPKPAFKPRFNANLIKSAVPKVGTEEVKAEAAANVQPDPAPAEPKEEPLTEPAKPAAYKPRFKPSMVKPKDPEE